MAAFISGFASEATAQISRLPIILLGFLTATLTLFLVIRQIFKPVGKSSRPDGRKWNLPPGPRGWPIVGNLFEMQARSVDFVSKLAEYGEMTSLQLGSKTWVTLNSNRVANELYNRRGTVTNGRPHLPMASGLISRDSRSIWMQGPRWALLRRFAHSMLSGSAMSKYADYQEMESAQLLADYLYHPENWYRHHGRYAISVIHLIALGERIDEFNKAISELTRVQNEFLRNGPPYNTIDCFPAMTKLPKFLQWGRKRAEALGQETYDVYSSYWRPVRDAIQAGNAGPSFARDVLLGEDTKFSGTEQEAMYLTLQMIEAGSDTTRASLNVFVLAALNYPEVYQKARAEVDRVCGTNAERLPMCTDEPNLPYIMAMLKEVLRWRPLFMWTPEHTLTEDLDFEGYSFPKGTSFVLNQELLSRDPAEFKDPEVFRPERFLDGNQADVLKGVWIFGGGRRVCVGYRLAQRSLFINIARLVYCYDFKANGPIPDRANHFMPTEPFPVKPVPRSKKHEELIIRSAEALDVLKFSK